MMKRALFFLTLVLLHFASASSNGAVVSNPMDLSGVVRSETEVYLAKLAGRTIEVSGILKDARDLKPFLSSMIYEIPVYSEESGVYKKRGFVCQREGSSKIFFAEDGFLPVFVRKNAVGKPVLARGRLIKNKKDLPEGMVFIIDSLYLRENN